MYPLQPALARSVRVSRSCASAHARPSWWRTLATSSARRDAAPHGSSHASPSGSSSPSHPRPRPGWERAHAGKPEGSLKSFFNSSGFETAAGASVGVLLLGVAALGYNKWYKAQVLHKMDKAFEGGYDPILTLSEAGGADDPSRLPIDPPRPEQELVSAIVRGREEGRYFLVMGPKGTGKSSMFIGAMADTQAEGAAYFEAHPDLTVVLDRFSEAINFSMNRDYLGSLLGLGDPSGTTTMQALERALHKLEQALILRREREKRPAVIIMSAAHLLARDEDGRSMLRCFQQRAERWANTGTATFVFLSDDYSCYKALRRTAVRMDTVTVRDLTRTQALNTLRAMRQAYYGDGGTLTQPQLDAVYRLTGGRLAILNDVARRQDMLRAAQRLISDEKHWILSFTGIIEDHDDDVMDEQKWSTCSWLLFVELAKRYDELEQHRGRGLPAHDEQDDDMPLADEAPHPPGPDTEVSLRPAAVAEDDNDDDSDPLQSPNPAIPWGEVRQIMTRPDYVEQLDHLHVVHIDRSHHVSAHNIPLLHAFRAVLREDVEFEARLERVMDRVSAIESLGRTRELVWKEQGDNGRFLVHTDKWGRELDAWTLLGGDERLGREGPDENVGQT